VARILIAEDDARIAASLEKVLQANGFTTFLAEDGEKAQSLSLTGEFDLMILDMGLPKREGFHVLQELRWRGKTLPVLVLTGRSERDVVACLEAGADDYMRKPFGYDELVARIRKRLEGGRREPGRNLLRGGGITLDLLSRRATVGDRMVELSPREFSLLEALLRHPGQILTRKQLLTQAWGQSVDATSNVVEVCVNQLRKKLGPTVVETVKGAGYRLGSG
jgi:two-component system copper resistance phosphate regulon response regulator CusR